MNTQFLPLVARRYLNMPRVTRASFQFASDPAPSPKKNHRTSSCET
jgi:hypothetical protein